MLTETLAVGRYYFEVNKGKSRVRVVIEYTYRGEQSAVDNDGLRPAPAAVQVPGLVYDSVDNAVSYTSDNHRTVCGIVKEQKSRFGTKLHVTNTGSCVITSSAVDRSRDDGWTLHKVRELDLFLEIR